MEITNDILVEDWEGLESETERLMIVYGYPTPHEISASIIREIDWDGSSGEAPGDVRGSVGFEEPPI